MQKKERKLKINDSVIAVCMGRLIGEYYVSNIRNDLAYLTVKGQKNSVFSKFVYKKINMDDSVKCFLKDKIQAIDYYYCSEDEIRQQEKLIDSLKKKAKIISDLEEKERYHNQIVDSESYLNSLKEDIKN